MQTNFFDKNKSRLIKLTETKKNKARRRLIGSIFLLVVALVILLKVTSRVTPISESKPVVIEIKNTRTVALKPIAASQIVTNTQEEKSTGSTTTKDIASSPSIAPIIASSPVKASNLVKSSSEVKVLSTSNEIKPSTALKPKIITDTPKATLSPEDILNGQSNISVKPRYFVQLIASSDKNKLIQMQDNFASKGIKTIIQSVDTPNGTVYRLRSGPFSNQMDAQNMLKDINSATSDE